MVKISLVYDAQISLGCQEDMRVYMHMRVWGGMRACVRVRACVRAPVCMSVSACWRAGMHTRCMDKIDMHAYGQYRHYCATLNLHLISHAMSRAALSALGDIFRYTEELFVQDRFYSSISTMRWVKNAYFEWCFQTSCLHLLEPSRRTMHS